MLVSLGGKVSRGETLCNSGCNVNIVHLMGKSTKSGKQVSCEMSLKASTKEMPKAARVRRGLKRPNSELLALIQVVNLMSSNDIGSNPRAMSEEEFMAWLE